MKEKPKPPNKSADSVKTCFKLFNSAFRFFSETLPLKTANNFAIISSFLRNDEIALNELSSTPAWCCWSQLGILTGRKGGSTHLFTLENSAWCLKGYKQGDTSLVHAWWNRYFRKLMLLSKILSVGLLCYEYGQNNQWLERKALLGKKPLELLPWTLLVNLFFFFFKTLSC